MCTYWGVKGVSLWDIYLPCCSPHLHDWSPVTLMSWRLQGWHCCSFDLRMTCSPQNLNPSYLMSEFLFGKKKLCCSLLHIHILKDVLSCIVHEFNLNKTTIIYLQYKYIRESVLLMQAAEVKQARPKLFFLISFTHQNSFSPFPLWEHHTLQANWESLGEFPLFIFYFQVLPVVPKRMPI